MRQRWERLTFLHWSFDPPAVQRLLPPGLDVETFDGAAWVGLVPFFMRVATGGGRGAPWASYFCETNVRTYVRDGEGRSGIWFFSLDAARLGAVAVARTAYRLPYFWSSMRISGTGHEVAYTCLRRWPGPRDATSQVRITIGEPFGADELAERDHFLTARWILFSVAGAGTGSRGHVTSHGPCTGRRPASSMTGWSRRPGCRSRRAHPWCITRLASMSASAVQRSQPGSGRPAKRRATPKPETCPSVRFSACDSATPARSLRAPPHRPPAPRLAAPHRRPRSPLGSGLIGYQFGFCTLQRAKTELITVIHREWPPATTQSAQALSSRRP